MRALFGLCGVFSFVFACNMGEGNLTFFVDGASLCLVVLSSTLITWGSYGMGDTFRALLNGFVGQLENYDQDLEILNTYRNLASAFGLLGALVGCIKLLAYLGDPTQVGPAVAVILLSCFYGILLSEVLLAPLIGRLRRGSVNKARGGSSLKMSPISMATIPFTLIAMGIVFVFV